MGDVHREQENDFDGCNAMMKIYESVAFGIVAVYELRELINEERNTEKKEVLECVRFSYYYLIKNLNEQFGVTTLDCVNALVANGYDESLAKTIVREYDLWAATVKTKNVKGDFT